MAHPAIVRFGGNLARLVTAVAVPIAMAAVPTVITAVTPFVLPVTVVVAAGAGAVMAIKGLSRL